MDDDASLCIAPPWTMDKAVLRAVTCCWVSCVCVSGMYLLCLMMDDDDEGNGRIKKHPHHIYAPAPNAQPCLLPAAAAVSCLMQVCGMQHLGLLATAACSTCLRRGGGAGGCARPPHTHTVHRSRTTCAPITHHPRPVRGAGRGWDCCSSRPASRRSPLSAVAA